MKAIAIQAFLFAILFSCAGCSTQQDSSVVSADTESSTSISEPHQAQNDEAIQSKEHQHKGHQHAFADPESLAARWKALRRGGKPCGEVESLAARWKALRRGGMIHLGTSRDEWQHPEEIVAALKLEAGQTVADIGAGTGYMVAHLSEAVGRNGTVIAIDAEAAMIEYLAKHLPELGPAHIVTQKVDFHDPELKPESVHGVLALDTCQSGRVTPGKCTTV